MQITAVAIELCDSSYIGLNSSHIQDFSITLPEETSLPMGSALIHLGSGVKSVKNPKVVQCVKWAK